MVQLSCSFQMTILDEYPHQLVRPFKDERCPR
jgi:hypothetical protein